MFNVKVEKVLKKDITEVFELLAQHDNYSRFKDVSESKLLVKGQDEKNGLGALRMLNFGAIKVHERITHFERPVRLDYLVEKSSPLPIKHQLGSITLEAIDNGTKVTWISKGHIAVPVLGSWLSKKFEKQVHIGLSSILKQIEQV